MPVITSLMLLLGPAVAKSILKFWLKNTWAEEMPRDIVDFLKKKTEDVLAQQNGKRQFEAIGEKVAENLLPLFESEQVNFSDERKEELVSTLTDTLENADLTPEILTARNLEPAALTSHLLQFQPKAVRDFSEPEREFFNRAISETSRSIIDIATQLPSFNERTFAEILKRETHLINITTKILEEVRRIREQSRQVNVEVVAAKFEEDYLLSVIRRLDELQLFGVDVSKASKRHKLSVAYVTLSVEQKLTQSAFSARSINEVSEIENGENADDEDEARVVLPVDRVLATSRRLLVRGNAGFGKTTLMQWIAVNSAGRKFAAELVDWNNTIPFYIRLREFVEKPLPPPETFPRLIASTIAAEMPASWAHEKLRSGQAIVLIDGVDELPETRRDEVRKWVDELVGNFQDCRFIVTSRPSAVEEGWLSNEGFEDAELQAMEMTDIVSFIDHWHAAVREELPEGEEKEELPELAEGLKAEIRRGKQKRELATSPLLCAMLCALHRDRKRQLPSDRVQLYEACIEMLIERRDIERGIQMHNYPSLGYRQKRVLLEELAYWMLKNNWPDVEWADAEEWLGKKLQNMQGLPTNATAAKVLDLLVERSGIVREPVPEHIDFTHKTFQEFLAAHAIINEGDTGLLIENAHKDQWREVVILAAGVTKKEREREEIISGLLIRGDQEVRQRYQLHLLAVACLENSISLSPTLKAKVESRLAQLLPPKNLTDAKALASAGELSLPYLAKYTHRNRNITVACIRTLMLIGGEMALDVLEKYAKDARLSVNKELLRAYQSIDFDTDYGKMFVSKVYKRMNTLVLSNIASLAQIDWPTNLLYLYVNDCSQLSDLTPLMALKNLKSMSFARCESIIDLSPLGRLTDLSSLTFYWCEGLNDLTPLVGLTNLRSLTIFGGRKIIDLNPLINLPKHSRIVLHSENSNLIIPTELKGRVHLWTSQNTLEYLDLS